MPFQLEVPVLRLVVHFCTILRTGCCQPVVIMMIVGTAYGISYVIRACTIVHVTSDIPCDNSVVHAAATAAPSLRHSDHDTVW